MSQFQFLETEVSLYSVLNVDGTEATLNNCIVIFHMTVWLFVQKDRHRRAFHGVLIRNTHISDHIRDQIPDFR